MVEFRAAGSTSSMFQSRSFGATVLSGDLGSLTPFITYDVRVLGENAVGRGDPSNTQTTRTHPDGMWNTTVLVCLLVCFVVIIVVVDAS